MTEREKVEATGNLPFGVQIPHSDALGLEILEASTGKVELRLPYRAELVGNPETGALFGGAVGAAIDYACGAAAQLSLQKGWTVATIDLRIDYLRLAEPGFPIAITAECHRLTRQVAFCRAKARQDGAGGPAVAEAMGTFMIYEAPKSWRRGDKK